jgi:acetoin utilization protein AcuB
MSRQVVTVGMDDSLATVRSLFREHQFHHLLVLDGRRLVGVISDRDLLKALSPRLGTPSETERDLATLNKRAHQVMSRQVVTIQGGVSVAAAARVLLEKRVSSLPILSPDGALEGIVTWKDLLRGLLAERSA